MRMQPAVKFGFTLLAGAFLVLSGCKQVLPSINVFVDPDPFMTYRVVPYYTNLNKVEVKQRHFGDASNPETSGVTSSAELLKNHFAADAYWSGDAIYCELLRQQKLTVPYHSTSDISNAFRGQDDSWTGLAPRIAVLLVRTSIPRTERPSSIRAYTDPKWKGRGAMVDPLKGSMRSHFAELAALWGDQQTAAFYKAVRDNDTKIAGSAEECADMVVEGDADFALLDSDVALTRIRRNLPVELVYPDQAPGEMGAIVMPTGLCIIRGCKNLPAARRLIDYLTSREGERRIITLAPAHVPLNEGLGTESPIMWRIEQLHVMPNDFQTAAKKVQVLEQILEQPGGTKD